MAKVEVINPVIQGFLSYAHFDLDTDPNLFEHLALQLERRVGARLLNADFKIWRDSEGIRTGDFWNPAIEAALAKSRVFIVILTPKWLESEYCRKEFEIFDEKESQIGPSEYIAPIEIRSLHDQTRYFTSEQKFIYDSIQLRQYKKIVPADFLRLPPDQRAALIDEISEDIAGMADRARQLEERRKREPDAVIRQSRSRYPVAFDSKAHDFSKVSILSFAEVLLNIPFESARAVMAQFDFLPKMYIQSEHGRIEFSVRRAFLTLSNAQENDLRVSDQLSRASGAYYVSRFSSPNALTICIDPYGDRTALSDQSLQPAQGENRYAEIAIAGPEVTSIDITATLSVSLCPEGLFILRNKGETSQRTARKIAAIMSVAVKKQIEIQLGEILHDIPVRERSS